MQRETQCQIAVVKFMRYHRLTFNASASGMHTSKTQAKIHKAMGVQKGFPDLMIFDPTPDDYVGFAIEMKSETGRARPEQLDWLNKLEQLGWKTAVCKGTEEAITLIESTYNL